MEILDIQDDVRSGCFSVLTNMLLREYKELIDTSFDQKGNIDGQRGVIKRSTSAAKIRKRMADDFNAGAIFPPVVIGLLRKERSTKEGLTEIFSNNLSQIENDLSIIDGMQRTNIYITNYEGNQERIIRVEFWVADQSVKLLYRMMVLNTGQVPWNTRRQIEVIYKSLSDNVITELYKRAPDLKDKIDIMGVDDQKRRRQPGRYQKSAIIEAYLGFNTRRLKVNLSDELANEFQRFDMIEVLEQNDSFSFFVDTLIMLCRFDFALALYDCESEDDVRFKSGKDIFTSTPACLGFTVACGEFILGKTSTNRDDEVKKEKLCALKENFDKIIAKVEWERTSNPEFLSLATLNEIIVGVSKNKIGDEERALFKNAFSAMLRDIDFNEISSLDAYWRE